MTDLINPDALVDIPALRTMWPTLAASTIRRWAHEGKLPRHGRDRRGRTLYRVSDVDDLMAKEAR